MMILEGPSGNNIGAGVAKILGARYAAVEHKLFPDGESYIRMPKIPEGEKNVAIVQSTYSPHEKHLIELLFMIDALKSLGTRHITAIVPYLAYVRQNKMFSAREAVSINTVLRLLSESGAEALITVEPHRYDVLSLFEGKCAIIDPTESFAEALSKTAPNPFVIATDSGDMVRAKKLAELLDCDFDAIEKERDYETGKVRAIHSIKTDLKRKDVIIFDDVISTGGTIELAARIAVENNARKVIAAATHLVMAGNAYERIVRAGVSELYGSNTIPFQNSRAVDVSPRVAEYLKAMKK